MYIIENISDMKMTSDIFVTLFNNIIAKSIKMHVYDIQYNIEYCLINANGLEFLINFISVVKIAKIKNIIAKIINKFLYLSVK